MKKVLKFKEFGVKVIITQDFDFDNPREWAEGTKMIVFHNEVRGDKHDYDFNHYEGWDEMEADILRKEKPAVILPLYLYNHSGLSISTEPFSCRWDSGQIGFILMDKKTAAANVSQKIVTAKGRENAIKRLIDEVKIYDQYLNNDVYHFKVKDLKTKDEVNSCGGFYGDTDDNGIFEHLDIEGLTLERYKEVFNQADFN